MQIIDNQQPSTLTGEGSTTSKSYINIGIPSSDGKRGAVSILKETEDIVCTLNENLKRFYNKKYQGWYFIKSNNK